MRPFAITLCLNALRTRDNVAYNIINDHTVSIAGERHMMDDVVQRALPSRVSSVVAECIRSAPELYCTYLLVGANIHHNRLGDTIVGSILRSLYATGAGERLQACFLFAVDSGGAVRCETLHVADGWGKAEKILLKLSNVSLVILQWPTQLNTLHVAPSLTVELVGALAFAAHCSLFLYVDEWSTAAEVRSAIHEARTLRSALMDMAPRLTRVSSWGPSHHSMMRTPLHGSAMSSPPIRRLGMNDGVAMTLTSGLSPYPLNRCHTERLLDGDLSASNGSGIDPRARGHCVNTEEVSQLQGALGCSHRHAEERMRLLECRHGLQTCREEHNFHSDTMRRSPPGTLSCPPLSLGRQREILAMSAEFQHREEEWQQQLSETRSALAESVAAQRAITDTMMLQSQTIAVARRAISSLQSDLCASSSQGVNGGAA